MTSHETGATDERRAEIEQGLTRVRGRIAEACAEAGRATDDVTLVVVTKNFGASDVRVLVDLGVTDVAENRHQEAEAKAEETADLAVRRHFVGGLQSNKAAAVVAYSDLVHSVDRAKLLGPLARGAERRGGPLDVLLQVSLDPPGSDHRAGVDPAELPDLAARAAATDGLVLRGLMAVAPLEEEPGAAFDRLADLHAAVLVDHPDATWLSAGMSGDLEAAVTRGATHVRVGSAVLGSRPPVG